MNARTRVTIRQQWKSTLRENEGHYASVVFFFFRAAWNGKNNSEIWRFWKHPKEKKMKTVALYLSWELEYWIKISWIEKKEKKEQFNQLVYYEIVA